MKIDRVWAMPNSNTFCITPIGSFVRKYVEAAQIVVDPFARNNTWATYSNDLNPNTEAQYHLDAKEFLELMYKEGVKADLVLFDPPYSLRQMNECYGRVGRKITGRESQRFYGDIRNAIDRLVQPGGWVLSFGWNSIGMGKKRGYRIEEILLVCHGRAHNDTICVADRKLQTNFMEERGEK